jgi:hypothetical protein
MQQTVSGPVAVAAPRGVGGVCTEQVPAVLTVKLPRTDAG